MAHKLQVLILLTFVSVSFEQVLEPENLAQEPDDFNYICKGNTFIGTWKVFDTNKIWTLTYSEFFLTLADSSCNKTVVCNYNTCTTANNHTLEVKTDNFGKKYVPISIQSELSNCGTTITENGNLKVLKNRVLLQLTVHLRNGVSRRKTNYEGLINCAVPEISELIQIGPTSNETFFNIGQENGPEPLSGKYDKSEKLEISSTMDFYKDDQFATKYLTDQIVVRSNDYIYTKIQLDFNTKYFKFVVDRCFASKEENMNTGLSESFFSNKCSLDETFKILSDENTKDHFSFKIKTFSFISESKSVYFHCQLYICRVVTIHPDCSQECTTASRKRRDVMAQSNDVTIESRSHRESNKKQEMTQKLSVSSKRIVLIKDDRTCDTKSCPMSSKCHSLSPAVCICVEGYIYSRVTGICLKERLAMIKNLQLDDKWKPEYENTSSVEFLKLATKYEDLLSKPFISGNTSKEIEGIRIINAREGSIIIDVQIIYVLSAERAFATFCESIQTLTSTARILKVKNLNTLTLVFPYGHGHERHGAEYRFPFTIVIVILVLLCIIFIVGIVLFHINQRKMIRNTVTRVLAFESMQANPSPPA